jgi:serine/threonine-protein kinase
VQVPRDLDTICMKCLEKDPGKRYPSASALADDLARFLEDKPIVARRPGLMQVAARWARRHKAGVWAAAVVLLAVAVLGGGVGLREVQKRVRAEGEAQAALKEAFALRQQQKWPEALSAIRRAKGVLAGVWADEALRHEVEELDRDVEMALRLQEARLRGAAAVKHDQFDFDAVSAAYEEAFAWYGLRLESVDPQQAGQFIRSRSIGLQLAAALDDWASWRKWGSKGRSQLLAIARVADPDPWRDRLRDALERQDLRALKELVASAQAEDLPPATVALLARLAQGTAEAERAVEVLRQAQQRHPDDFWVNHELGWCLYHLRPPRLEEAIRYYSVAVALRPQSPGARLTLGTALHNKGKVAEAIAYYHRAIAIAPKFASAHSNLGVALQGKGKVDEAIECYHRAIALDPRYANAHINLGKALKAKGKVDEAIACFHRAIAIAPKLAPAHNSLGNALKDKGKVDEAIECFHWAIALDRKDATAHNNLGAILCDIKRDYQGAIRCFRRAIAIDSRNAQTHFNLGNALRNKGQRDEAIAEYRQAIRLKEDYAEAHCNLGLTLQVQGEFRKGLEALRRCHQIGSRDPRWPHPSDQWVQQCERLVELDRRLPGFLEGKTTPASANERIELAGLCSLKRLHRGAARFYKDAFAAQPSLVALHRYNAACAAALAGCGQGKDAASLDQKQRASWRQQALDWLRADLTARDRHLETKTAQARALVQQQMKHWQQDADLAGVRGPEALARLPEAERSAWRKLWSDVADTLARAQGKASPPKKPNSK